MDCIWQRLMIFIVAERIRLLEAKITPQKKSVLRLAICYHFNILNLSEQYTQHPVMNINKEEWFSFSLLNQNLISKSKPLKSLIYSAIGTPKINRIEVRRFALSAIYNKVLRLIISLLIISRIFFPERHFYNQYVVCRSIFTIRNRC